MLYLTSFKIAADFTKFSEYLTTNSYLSYLQLMLQEDIFVTRRHICYKKTYLLQEDIFGTAASLIL